MQLALMVELKMLGVKLSTLSSGALLDNVQEWPIINDDVHEA